MQLNLYCNLDTGSLYRLTWVALASSRLHFDASVQHNNVGCSYARLEQKCGIQKVMPDACKKIGPCGIIMPGGKIFDIAEQLCGCTA